MALTESKEFELGMVAPDFTLVNTVTDEYVSLADVKGSKGTVVMFICNHCPYVVHINEELVRLAHDYMERGFGFVAISSNDVATYPEDGPDQMKQTAEELGYPFPYLFDATQEVARAYDARCTPDIYVFDAELKLAYHGQLDDSRPRNSLPVTGSHIRSALDGVLSNQPPLEVQVPSIGCNIKWRT
jgi:peroxiredoxin